MNTNRLPSGPLLENSRIISTRPLETEDELKEALLEKSAKVLDFPMIAISFPEVSFPKQGLSYFDWVVFSSKNAVKGFFNALVSQGIEISDIGSLQFAVIGKKTAKTLGKFNCTAALISGGNTAQDLLTELLPCLVPESRILLALGNLAADTLEKGLSQFEIQKVEVYQTRICQSYPIEIIEIIRENQYDLIIFTSPSAVRNFFNIMQKYQVNAFIKACCIGTTTAQELRTYQTEPLLISSKSDSRTFAAEIEQYLKQSRIHQ